MIHCLGGRLVQSTSNGTSPRYKMIQYTLLKCYRGPLYTKNATLEGILGLHTLSSPSLKAIIATLQFRRDIYTPNLMFHTADNNLM